jgi:hypothetical protein
MRTWMVAGTAVLLSSTSMSIAGESVASQPIEAMVPAICPAQVENFARNPRLAGVLGSAPLDSKAICDCANERFLQDPQVSPLVGRPLGEVLRDTGNRQDAEFAASYLSLRAFGHVMSCMAEEIDRRLDEVELPVSVAAPVERELREYADTILPLVIASDADGLWQHLPPSGRSSLTPAQITVSLATMRELVGRIEAATYWRSGPGIKTSGGTRIAFYNVSYHLKTDLPDAVVALQLNLVFQDGRYWLMSFSGMKNIGKLPTAPPPAAVL